MKNGEKENFSQLCIVSAQEDDGGRTVKVEVSLLVLRLPPGVPQPHPQASSNTARAAAAAADPASSSSGCRPDSLQMNRQHCDHHCPETSNLQCLIAAIQSVVEVESSG